MYFALLLGLPVVTDFHTSSSTFGAFSLSANRQRHGKAWTIFMSKKIFLIRKINKNNRPFATVGHVTCFSRTH